ERPGRRERSSQQRHARRRRDADVTVAAVLVEMTRWPFEVVPQRREPGESLAGQLLEIGELREIDAAEDRVEAVRRLHPLPERLDRIDELRGAAVELRAGGPDVEPILRPAKRSVQGRESIVVQPGKLARKRPGEIAVRILPRLVEAESAVEVAVAGEPPRRVLEEQLAHAREVHARVQPIALIR